MLRELARQRADAADLSFSREAQPSAVIGAAQPQEFRLQNVPIDIAGQISDGIPGFRMI
jgi:hypothetical protein